MNKKTILESVKKLREVSKKRNFTQSIDFIANLKQLNVKNPDQKVDLFLQLPKLKTKKPKICALIDKELATQAKIFNTVILKEDFPKYAKDKKLTKKLASSHDYFIAQANLMGEIATIFGKILGQKGKMPNPKAGQIVPPVIPSLQPIKTKIESSIRLVTKDQLVVKSSIGSEEMSDEDLTENIYFVYNALLHSLPTEKENIKSIFIKLTMSPSVEITENGPVIHEKKETKKEKESKEKAEVKKLKKEKKPKEDKK